MSSDPIKAIRPQLLGYLPGAYSGRTNAMKFGELMTSNHTALINSHKGGKNYKIIKGGNDGASSQQQTVIVHQNHIPGPKISTVDSNTNAVAGVTTYLNSINNEDCYATNTCVDLPKQNGGGSKRKTSKRKTSKHKSSKRKTSKRKTSKRKTSKRKSSKRKTSKRKSTSKKRN
jgi:hypothetical protein